MSVFNKVKCDRCQQMRTYLYTRPEGMICWACVQDYFDKDSTK